MTGLYLSNPISVSLISHFCLPEDCASVWKVSGRCIAIRKLCYYFDQILRNLPIRNVRPSFDLRILYCAAVPASSMNISPSKFEFDLTDIVPSTFRFVSKSTSLFTFSVPSITVASVYLSSFHQHSSLSQCLQLTGSLRVLHL